MKSFKQALIMALAGSLAVLTASCLNLPTWVLFTAWVSYYLLGPNPKTALLVFTQQIFGILIAITMQYGGTFFTESAGIFGAPLVVFIILIGVFYISKMKHLNSLPAYFLGMIIWFGSNTTFSWNTLFILGLTLIIGFTFAWMNVTLNDKIELKYQSND